MGFRGPLLLLCAALLAVCALGSTKQKAAVFLPRNLIEKIDSKIQLNVSTTAIESSGDYVTVSWSGVQGPEPGDMIALYLAERELSDTWPIKYVWTSSASTNGTPLASGEYKFQIYNYYEPVVFYFLRGAFANKFVAARSKEVGYANAQQPTQIKLAFTDDPSEMRVTWLAGEHGSPVVWYGTDPKNLSLSATVSSTTYGRKDMCDAPANSTGWKAPGTILTAIMTDFEPNTEYYYVVGDEGEELFSAPVSFLSAPGPDDTVRMLALADVGQHNEDGSRNFGYWYSYYISDPNEFYAIDTLNYTAMHLTFMVSNAAGEQDGTIDTYPALYDEIATTQYHSMWHNGDVSYARGSEWQWDTFGHQMTPVTSTVPTMYSYGNHEYDVPNAYDVRFTSARDSGGECGVPAKMRSPMPFVSERELYYSINHGPVHFLQLNTEMVFAPNSTQWRFALEDLASVDRSVTPWVVVGFHRMMYTDDYLNQGQTSGQTVATDMREAFEEMFFDYGVDMTWQGHLHIYQRTCPVFNNTCLGYDEETGVARGPIHVTMGNAGYQLTPFYQPDAPAAFDGQPSFSGFGYCRAEANRTHFTLQLVEAATGELRDEFTLTKPEGWEAVHPEDNAAVREEIVPTPFPESVPNSGWTTYALTVFPSLVQAYPEEAMKAFGPGTTLWKTLNGPYTTYDPPFILESALAIIDFIDAHVNETNYEDFVSSNASSTYESYLYVRSAWQGRIADIIAEQYSPLQSFNSP